MDMAGSIRGVEFTSSQQGNSPVLPGLLVQIPAEQPIGTVTGHGAYDTRTCHTARPNRFSARGRAEVVRIAQAATERGMPGPRPSRAARPQ